MAKRKTEAWSAWATQTAASWAAEVERVGQSVKTGMSEAELLKVMGKPASRSDGTLFFAFGFEAPPFWDEGEAFPEASLRLNLSKKKQYDGRLHLEWSAGDPNDAFPDDEFQAVASALAAHFAETHGPATKVKGKLKEFTFPEAKDVQLTVRGGVSYQTAQLTLWLDPR
ncbi:MAG: hypothetical protein GQE15_38190 [Archangiaceae bacterium]|nr:hypothetical protein [Archangiaceae bacterium]